MLAPFNPAADEVFNGLDLTKALDEHAIVAVTDARGRILQVNDKFCCISKYSRAELVGQDHRIINSGNHSPAFFRELWNSIQQGRVWKGEICNRAKDRSFFWVDTTILPFPGPDGKPRHYVAIRADITERKLAEEKLKVSLKELAEMKAALDEYAVVAITDARGRITHVNDKFCALSKYAREELLGQDHRLINSGQHPAAFILNLWQTISQGKVWKGEICNRAKDGSLYWVDTTIVPFIGPDRKPVQYVAIRADITERKRAEQRQGELLGALREINLELNQFAYVVSHDLKAPLRAINSLASWLAADNAGRLGDEAKLQFELLVGRVKRMDAMIDGILSYSRIGREQAEITEIDLNELIAEVCEMISPPPLIAVRTAGLLPKIWGERTRLIQVFENLIGNAVRYMGKPSGEVLIGCEAEANAWKLFVRDTGPGIEEKHFEKVFQLFQTLERRDDRESTGIGLAVVKKNIEASGGQVWIESRIGEGSTFHFRLPSNRQGRKDHNSP